MRLSPFLNNIVVLSNFDLSKCFLCSFSVRSDMKIAYATLRLANASICSHQKNATQGVERKISPP